MRFDPPEPKGKLDTMTGYSWSTPAVATAPVVVNGPEDVVPDWDVVEWRRHEGNVGRLRQRIFTAAQDEACTPPANAGSKPPTQEPSASILNRPWGLLE